MPGTEQAEHRSGPGEVFRVFLKLGLTSFGGPIAHIGYFRDEFVRRRGWLDDLQFAQLLAVCQFLPGPASSQMGFAIGLQRSGWLGAWAAFVAFTLPSAVLMWSYAVLAPRLSAGVGAAVGHGLKLVAVVVVAHGLIGMTRQLAPDWIRKAIAVVAVALALSVSSAWMQLLVIALGGGLGWLGCRHVIAPMAANFALPLARRGAIISLLLFSGGLVLAWAVPDSATPSMAGLAAAFYEAGALVFGGGHVVLPLLQERLVDSGWMATDTFLAGYGAAQAVPGPMFSLAAFLGAEVPLGLPTSVGAGIALLAVFLPGFLLLLGVLPIWSSWVERRGAASIMAGINAAVVGLLGAAFIDPVCTTGLQGPVDIGIAIVGIALLAIARVSALWVVLWCVVATAASTLFER